ncbi:MAG TPA: molybdopterin-synthase adenylyltransferase MoeB [Vicinamibacterales bacterium]|nr:molybdopterin-synthase adenylyltransferase MoeB [Vicinamibacterales bacterium]
MREAPRSTPAELSHDEVRRYSRHLLLPEVGLEGQRRLKAARVLCVGAGGLGSPVSMYLAAAGIGTLGIVDDDVVDPSNLQRQVLHGTGNVGQPKVESALARLRDINPEIRVVPHPVRLTRDNALALFADYDLVVDGTDNFATRYLVNDASVLGGRPYVYGSVFRFEGQASVFAMPGGPCYRCLFPEPPPPGLVPGCAEGGVLGVLPGIIGSIQANEAIKLVLAAGQPLVGRLLLFDALDLRFREVRVRPDPDCPICGTRPTIRELQEYDDFCGARPPSPSGRHDVTPIELKQKLDAGERPVLLDVREPMEHLLVKLPGSVLVPLGDLAARLPELDPARDFVVYCHHGVRSARAADVLSAAGLRASNLAGGIAAWTDQVDPTLPRY